MTTYKNLSDTSGIESFEIGSDYITVYFSDNAVYNYTTSSANEYTIEEMKRLALKGIGLNAYINEVKPTYASVS